MAHHHHTSGKNLKVAFLLNLSFAIVEVFGGLLTNSIAIISDALHDFGDSLSLGLAWYLDKKSRKGASETYSFGYERFSLLGALINSVVLIVGAIFIVSEAIERLQNPELSNAKGMILFALIGIAVNGYAAYRLEGGKSLNEKVVKWHLLEDVLGWAAILIAAIILLFKDIPYIDPVLSILITAYILFNVGKRLKETLHIFLQGVPVGVDVNKIEEQLRELVNVESLHHTHIWSLDGEHHVFSTHLKLRNIEKFDQIMDVKQEAKDILEQYDFEHYTIETELSEENCPILEKHLKIKNRSSINVV
jgi:cobalt-zinc-cadmium efflux system protein